MKITSEEYTRLVQAETKLNLLLDVFRKSDEYEVYRMIRMLAGEPRKKRLSVPAVGTQPTEYVADAE